MVFLEMTRLMHGQKDNGAQRMHGVAATLLGQKHGGIWKRLQRPMRFFDKTMINVQMREQGGSLGRSYEGDVRKLGQKIMNPLLEQSCRKCRSLHCLVSCTDPTLSKEENSV